MCVYLYYENEKDTSGHYCLINKDEKIKGIKEIKENFKKKWKSLNDNVSNIAFHSKERVLTEEQLKEKNKLIDT